MMTTSETLESGLESAPAEAEYFFDQTTRLFYKRLASGESMG